MGTPIPEFIEVVVPAGGWVDDHERLHFPRTLVEECIGMAAKEFTWHGFDDDRSIVVGGDRVHFGTAGAAVSVWDHETRKHRPSDLQDLYDVARLVDTLEHIHFHVRTLVARDMVESRDLDLNSAYAVAMGTTKPMGTSFFQPEHVHEVVDMFDEMLGGQPGSFAERPFCVANNTFVVPPLRYAEDAVRSMVAQVRTGMPINLLSAGQAGATSPAALAGSLAQALAECLSALTCVNLLNPSHPCVMGLWPFVSDLRTGAMTGGSGEEAVLNAAAAQMANWLGLPSGVAAGMADSKVPDNQAGHEKGLTVALAGHAGANLVYESAGMLASLLACSYEALVIDNDMLGAVNRTVRGIEVTPDNLEEYLQLYAEHHLIGAIREQVNAVRQGLGVFLDEALMAKLRACCTVAEFQLMLCGAPEIDVDDWQASTEYRGGYSAGSDQVKWFWAEVHAMTPEERGQLLFFCTGSARAPATGFANLMGYSGQQQRFTIERDDRGTERPPTAATCFNTLKLPPYASAETLAAKLRLIFWAQGFHEGAVAT